MWDADAPGPEVVEVDDYGGGIGDQVEVKTEEDLDKEFQRLDGFLSNLESPWQSRMACMHRVQTIVLGGEALKLPNFVTTLAKYQRGLAKQLSDRRSKVVKECTTTLSILSQHLAVTTLSNEQHNVYVGVVKTMMEESFQTLVQSVKVISRAGDKGLKDLMEHVTDDEDHTLLRTLLGGAAHVHQAVRATCLACMTIALHKWSKRMKETGGTMTDKDKLTVDEVESTVRERLHDSSASARGAARHCLIELFKMDEPRAQAIVDTMSAAVRKRFQSELDAAMGKKKSKKSARKAKAGRRRTGISALRRQARLAKKKAMQNGNNDDVLVVAKPKAGAAAAAAPPPKDAQDKELAKPPPVDVNAPSGSVMVFSPSRHPDDAKASTNISVSVSAESILSVHAVDENGNEVTSTSPAKRAPRKRTKKRRNSGSHVSLHSPMRAKNMSMDITDKVLLSYVAKMSKDADQGTGDTMTSTAAMKLNATTPINLQSLREQTAKLKLEEKDKAQAPTSGQQEPVKRRRAREVLERVFDLKEPRVTTRMISFLEDGPERLDVLMGFLSRMSIDTIEKIVNSELRSPAVNARSVSSRQSPAQAFDTARLRATSLAPGFAPSDAVKNAVSATDSHTSVVAQSQLELPTTRGASASVSHERAVTPTALRKAPPAALSAGSGLQGIPEDVQHQPDPHAATTFDMDTMGRRSSNPNISSLRVRPSTGDQEKEIRRSHTAMTFLCKHEPLLVGFVKKHIRVITLHLLAGFHPTSLANFYHVCKVLSQLVRWFPVEVIRVVLSHEGSLFYRRMFDNLHEPPVSDSVLDIICAPCDKADKKKLFKFMLEEWRVMEVITQRICDPRESQATSSYNVLFMTQFLDRVMVHQRAVLLISSICAPNSLVDSLVVAISNENHMYKPWQRLQCANLLASILKRSSSPLSDEPGTASAGSPSHVPSRGASADDVTSASVLVADKFSDVYPVMVKKLAPQLGHLCDALVGLGAPPSDKSTASTAAAADDHEESKSLGKGPDVKFSGYAVDNMFTKLRLSLMETLKAVCSGSAGAVERIPQDSWITMVNWFFEYRHNNMYLSCFRALFVSVLRHPRTDLTLNFILVKCKLLERMINFYNNKDNRSCSLHSFILDLCNHMRLTADYEVFAELPRRVHRYLGQHKLWAEFLPTLRRETMKQAERLWNTPKATVVASSALQGATPMPRGKGKSSGGDRIPAQPAATSSGGVSSPAPAAPAPSSPPSTPPRPTNLIDLGSAYATRMGYIKAPLPSSKSF